MGWSSWVPWVFTMQEIKQQELETQVKSLSVGSNSGTLVQVIVDVVTEKTVVYIESDIMEPHDLLWE